MNFLSKLTLLVPTYNRQEYVLRNMRYWSGRGAAVHVLDGSPAPICTSDLSGLSNNIHYHHLHMSFSERIRHSMDLIQTDYCALMGDDEFLMPRGLEACISEMDANRELVSCMGRCLIFKPTSRGVVSWPGYTEMKDYTLLQNDPVERMIAHMNPYTCSTIYSVVRTPVWKTAMSILSERNFSVFAIGEYQFELAVSFLGKSKVLDSLMWLRSGENPTATPAPLWGKHKLKMFYRWWIDKDTFDERKEFLDIMSDSLALSSPIDRTTIYRGVEKAAEEFSQYTSSHYKMNYPKRKYYFGVALAHLIKYVPRRVRNGLKELSWQYKPRPLITSIESLEKLSLAGITFDKSELSEIEEVLINFHNHQLRK